MPPSHPRQPRSAALASRWPPRRGLSARRLAAALLAAGALLLAVTPAHPAPAGAAAESRSAVLVAAHDLAAGRTISAQDLRSAARTTTELPDGALTAAAEVTGRVLTGAVRQGEIITDLRLLGPGLSAGLGPGVVASPVRLVDLEIAGLLHPGDRVDILAATSESTVAVVVAARALVLAVPLTESGPSAEAEPLGLVVVAVPQDTAALLAAAAASSTLTATLLPP